MTNERQRAVYDAEHERFLEGARMRGLLTEDEERRLRRAYHSAAESPQRGPASVLPMLLLDAEDAGVLATGAGPEQVSARWDLYETIREQTHASPLRSVA
jgi:hypothetical protein